MQKIAVIGLSCLFPGAHTPEQFIKNLNHQVDSTRLHSREQMGADPSLYYSKKKGQADKYYSVRGGYITDFNFDASGYQLAESVLQQLDDAYKWSLYVAREALSNGGYLENKKKLKTCGLILGNLSFPTKNSNRLYLPLYDRVIGKALRDLLEFDLSDFETISDVPAVHPSNGRISGYPAAVVAQALGLSETFFSLDAACASSLFSVKLACDYLNSGKADLMLAGAVSAGDPFFINQGFSTFTAYSANDISCPLDKRSEGLVSGEGAGMLLLKRYEDALKDKDNIQAVISAIGLSSDGKGRSVLSPNKKGQLLAYERAYEAADISPDQIDYIECHATGTQLGDMTELESLDLFFGRHRAAPLIGAVKANFGHLLTCAGMASMIKVIMSMSQSEIPATIHLKQPVSSPNGVISSDQVVSQSRAWPKRSAVKLGAVNAFGFGGTNAHLIFEEPSTSPPAKKRPNSRPQAMSIVGMEACFGPYQNLAAFDHGIYSGRQGFIPLPQDRWKGMEQDQALLETYGIKDVSLLEGGYLPTFDFDTLRYKIPPNEIESMIPQQLLLLKVADKAVIDAGLREGSNVAVIVAMESDKTLHQFRGRIDLDRKTDQALQNVATALSDLDRAELKDVLKDSIRKPVQVNEFTSFIGNIMASRVSALWDFSGPAFTVSAEDNSVYKALQVAQLLLENQEVDAVVIGAVDLAGNLEDILIRNRFDSPYSTTPVSFGLDAGTSGWKVGEGAGAVVLKSSEKAGKDNSRCYATIETIGFKADSRQESVQELCIELLAGSQMTAADVKMLEISGVGKEAEIFRGISAVYQGVGDSSCALGSVNSTIGHTYTASGIASLIKSALCLHHRYIPAVPAFNGLKALPGVNADPFYTPTESRYWPSKSHSKRALAISGIGSDGSIAQLIMTEDPFPKKRTNHFFEQEAFVLYPLTAHSKTSLLEALNLLEQDITSSDNLFQLACQRHVEVSAGLYKAVIMGNGKESLLAELELAKKGIAKAFEEKSEWLSPTGSFFTTDPLASEGNLAFVYPGAFNSYIGMGKDLFRMFPDLAELLPTYSSHPETLLHDRMLFPRSLKALTAQDIKIWQEKLENDVIPTFETGIHFAMLKTALLRGAFGIQPKSAFGYSMGEVSMAFSLGLWSNTDHMSQTLHHSPLFKERLAGAMITARKAWGLPTSQSDKNAKIWSSFVVQAPAAEIEQRLAKAERVYLLLINSPSEVIIGGETTACQQFLKAIPFTTTATPLNDVIHCQLVEKERQQIYEMQNSPVNPNKNIRLYSAAGYGETKQSSHDLAENIANIYCKTLDFPRLVNTVYQDGSRIFLEVGPKSNCSRWIDEILEGRDHLTVSLDNKGAPEQHALFKALAKLYSHGITVDFSAVFPPKIALTPGKNKATRIRLGGDPVYQAILNSETIKKFRKQPAVEPVKPVVPDVPVQPVAKTGKLSDSLPEITIRPGAEGLISENVATPELLAQMDQEMRLHQTRISQSHGAFLTARAASLKHLREMIKLKIMLGSEHPVALVEERPVSSFKGDPYLYPETRKPGPFQNVIWDESDLLEFAGGKIASVFGPEYEVIDSYKYRVQLPMPPYLLVNRVTALNAKRGEYKPSSLTTEYDIAEDAWFSVDGQIPWAIASEAGQCDLLLISYLGIDFQSKGERYYRLTDYTMTFFDELPKAGETLRYEIKIESFIRSGEALFFNFGYDCFVGNRLVYQMSGGRAGFISDAELALGKGIVLSKAEENQRRAISKQEFTPLLSCHQTSFSREELLNITQGRIAACFGRAYDQGGLNPSLRFAAEEILMLDRIVSVDSKGGPWGLGEVVAEKDLAPDHWYFPCHFKDDNVLAGTLVTEGCVQLLGFYMLYLGLQVKTKDARFQPVKNRPYAIRARGQILPSDTRFSYKMEIIEIGLEPRPFARANFYINMNGKILVDFRDLGVELLEKSPSDPAYQGFAAVPKQAKPAALFGPEVIEEFATGSLANCFGPEFSIYENRRGPRTPNGDLKLVSRIMELRGEPHHFKEPSELVAEYDVPADAWFFTQNSYPIMPYSIVMEIALQPCAFLSAYMGTTLVYPEAEMCFRNLASTAELLSIPDLRGKTIVDKIKMTSVSKAAETVVLSFTYELVCEGVTFYKGVTQFGYFTPHALSMQKGLDRGEKLAPWFEANNLSKAMGIAIDLQSTTMRKKFFETRPARPHYRLAGDQLEFLDEAVVFPKAGKYNQGYVYASKRVNPKDWFYPFHFYNDPVMPGSLGVEAILQSMKIFVLQQDLGRDLVSPRFVSVPGVTKWLYRGQITPDNETMDLEVHLKSIETAPNQIILRADANLWKNGMRIYEITDAAIALIGDNR